MTNMSLATTLELLALMIFIQWFFGILAGN